jgi:hypothetical protein
LNTAYRVQRHQEVFNASPYICKAVVHELYPVEHRPGGRGQGLPGCGARWVCRISPQDVRRGGVEMGWGGRLGGIGCRGVGAEE